MNLTYGTNKVVIHFAIIMRIEILINVERYEVFHEDADIVGNIQL